MINDVIQILEKADSNENNIRPTLLYNEGWLLNIVLKQLKEKKIIYPKLEFPNDSDWFSEALLPTPFKASKLHDNVSEKDSHADGVVGKFEFRENTKAGLELKDSCDFFYVIEAKMYSPLSRGVTHAKKYNQVARTIACIANLIFKKNLSIDSFKKIGFYVLLPDSRKNVKSFVENTNVENIKNTILKRNTQYFDSKLHIEKNDFFDWLNTNIDKFLKKLDVDLIAWEELIDKHNNKPLDNFYENCKKYNNPRVNKHIK